MVVSFSDYLKKYRWLFAFVALHAITLSSNPDAAIVAAMGDTLLVVLILYVFYSCQRQPEAVVSQNAPADALPFLSATSVETVSPNRSISSTTDHYCASCGHHFKTSVNYCPQCGQKTSVSSPITTDTPVSHQSDTLLLGFTIAFNVASHATIGIPILSIMMGLAGLITAFFLARSHNSIDKIVAWLTIGLWVVFFIIGLVNGLVNNSPAA